MGRAGQERKYLFTKIKYESISKWKLDWRPDTEGPMHVMCHVYDRYDIVFSRRWWVFIWFLSPLRYYFHWIFIWLFLSIDSYFCFITIWLSSFPSSSHSAAQLFLAALMKYCRFIGKNFHFHQIAATRKTHVLCDRTIIASCLQIQYSKAIYQAASKRKKRTIWAREKKAHGIRSENQLIDVLNSDGG